MGPSGSGKTTFLNVAGLLDTFSHGTYRLDGQDVSRLNDDQMSRIRNQKIGFVFQSFNLIPDLDAFDNVDVPLRYRGLPGAERKERVERALELVGLGSRARHLPSQLSGGQQQRVAIARVLAGDPRLILAVEPTGNLDSLMTREIMDLLERINEQGARSHGHPHPECASRAQRQVHLPTAGWWTSRRRRTWGRPERGWRPASDRSGHVLLQLRIALLSLRRNPILSTVIIGGIALGIAVATLFSTMRHVLARDPVPGRSDSLYYVRMDNWDPLKPYPGDDPTRPPTQISYPDMVNIMRSDIPTRQTGMFKTNLYVFPDPKVGRPTKQMTRMCFSDFFAMFDLPFRYGSGWDRQADTGPEAVVVLSEELNETLFGGAHSVVRMLRIEDREFKVWGCSTTGSRP